MRKLTLLASAAALAAAAPAAAQIGVGIDIGAQLGGLQSRIEADASAGRISSSQASALRAEYRQLADLQSRYNWGGLSASERADIQARIEGLRQRIDYAERSGGGAGDGQPYGQGYGQAYGQGYAQPYGQGYDNRNGYGYGNNGYSNGYGTGAYGDVGVRLDRLGDQVDRALSSGRLSRSEASELRAQYRDLVTLERRYARNGLAADERADLDRRITFLQQRLDASLGYRGYDDRNRGYGQGYNQGYDNGWRDTDRRCPPGLDWRNNGCVPPGQYGGPVNGGIGGRYNLGDRLPPDLNFYNIPDRFRSQFRDTADDIYRYSDGYVYRVDARTGAIVQVYDVRNR
jgi:hypothetical protein